ncbi:putative aldehyde oxidase 4 [Armadillidium nasatum]|uniref:Putative aldehyde oxidase 4 n=1 Tax=Armadillidium nasatum TaxID=96803 RepID=A0A5N5TBG0_9CRUS|nr:putative aldehyde oxidase 4 [Armadillidium nasatum]
MVNIIRVIWCESEPKFYIYLLVFFILPNYEELHFEESLYIFETAEQNKFGYIVQDEEVFATEEVRCVGQIIGIVLAESRDLAEEAKRAVKVYYEETTPPIFSIEEAIEANSVWEPIKLETGNLEEGFQNSKHVLEGESRTGFQEHFYMETNVHIAVPYDNNELHLIG